MFGACSLLFDSRLGIFCINLEYLLSGQTYFRGV